MVPDSNDRISQSTHDSNILHSPKRFICPTPACGKSFHYKCELERHLKTHTNQRPFKCPFAGCNKAFKRQDALKNHERLHTKEKPYECEFEGCDQSFTSKASLQYHQLKHKAESDFKCQFPGCNKTFLTYNQLKIHMSSSRVHKKLTGSLSEANIEQSQYTPSRIGEDTESNFLEGNTKNQNSFLQKRRAYEDFECPPDTTTNINTSFYDESKQNEDEPHFQCPPQKKILQTMFNNYGYTANRNEFINCHPDQYATLIHQIIKENDNIKSKISYIDQSGAQQTQPNTTSSTSQDQQYAKQVPEVDLRVSFVESDITRPTDKYDSCELQYEPEYQQQQQQPHQTIDHQQPIYQDFYSQEFRGGSESMSQMLGKIDQEFQHYNNYISMNSQNLPQNDYNANNSGFSTINAGNQGNNNNNSQNISFSQQQQQHQQQQQQQHQYSNQDQNYYQSFQYNQHQH